MKKGLMASLLEKAQEAQPAQQTSQEPAATTGVVASADKGRGGATTVRVSGDGKGKTHPAKRSEYASDNPRPVRGNQVLYGMEGHEAGPSQLPRKRRAKR